MSETTTTIQQKFTTIILGENPYADLSPGSTLSELLLKLSAAVDVSVYNDIENVAAYTSVETALAATPPTYTPAIDQIASNFNVSRNQGSYSTGVIQVVVSQAQGYTVPAGFTWLQPGINLQYTASTQVVVAVNPNTNTNQQPLFTLGNGTFYFLVPVVAAAVGSAYQVNNGAQFTPVAPSSISNFVSASAYGNFTSGLPEQSDQQLIAEFQANLNSSFCSPQAIQTALTTQYPGFQALSAIGMGDPEMTRNRQNILGIATGGMADLYIRTAVGPETIQIAETGTKIADGLWQINIGPNDAPGFYNILNVLPTPASGVTVAGTLPISSTTYGYQQSMGERNNFLTSAADARFTKYQTCQLVVEYSESPALSVDSTTSFTLTLNIQPNIAPIQDLFLADNTRIVTADYLVKAVVPCFVSVTVNLLKLNPNDTLASINASQLTQDIFNYINTIPFGSSLYASQIIKLAHNYPIRGVQLPVRMTGNIFAPTGVNELITDNDILTIPTDLPNNVTPNTTMYFVDYFSPSTGNNISNIAITLN